MSAIHATDVQFRNATLDTHEKNAAGEKLLALCTKVAPLQRDLTAFEDAMLGEYSISCALEDRANLTHYIAQALKVLLKARRYNVVLVLLRKLKGLASERFLRDATGILPLTLACYFDKETRWKLWTGKSASDEFIDVIRLLVENGADVKDFDNYGNTSLFYACMIGHHGLFRMFLEQGAAVSTTHTFFSWRQVTSSNLLQATLEAFVWDEIEGPTHGRRPWEDLENGWRRIAGDLLDVGQQSSADDPRMVQLLQTACFQGHFPWIERLIEFGVPIDAPTTRQNARQRFYACSLHAAAAGGHPPVVQLLLNRGARPLDKGLSTCAQDGYGDRKTREQTALAVAIDETSVAPEKSPRKPKLWETCILLMEAESLPEDHMRLLELSARDGQVSLVKRLLHMGYRLDQVPETKSFEVIQLLIQHGSGFDPHQAQKRAINWGDFRRLSDLFRTWGNLVTFDELWRSPAPGVSNVGIDMLDAILSVHGINEIFHTQDDIDGQGVTLVQTACRRGWRASVEYLLEKGANLYLPEPDNNALTTLKHRLTTRRRGTGTDTIWELFQLLERHMPKEGQEIRDRCMSKSQRYEPVFRGVNHNSSKTRPRPASPETQPLLPMDRIDGDEFEHTPLSGRDEFRTMILHPSRDPEAPIECELVQYALFLAPEYEAISYVWGDNTVPRYIRLNRKVLQITSNLYDALLALRRESEPRHLWVDAVCINQGDVSERNQQVTLMGDIYMGASRVVIWLGNAGEDSHLVFQHIARFLQHQDDVFSGRCRPTDEPINESHINMPPYEGATGAALDRLFQRPWFFRTWVIQEKVLSKEALVCCGSESASWDDIFAGVSHSTVLNDRPLHGPNYNDRAHRIHTLRPLTSSRDLLQYSRDCQVTDPKDRIYGILGILKPGLIEVKYESDVQEIYRSFTQAVIEDSGSIELLNLWGTRHTLPNLPSWVPDFSIKRSSCHLPGPAEDGVQRQWPLYNPPPDIMKALPGLGFRNHGRDLVVKGKAVDTVLAVGNEMPVSQEYALGTEKFAQVFSEWEALAIENAPSHDSSTCRTSADSQGPVSSSFLATLIAVNTDIDKKRFRVDWPIGGVMWYKQHGTGALMKRERQYFEDVVCYEILGAGDWDDSSSGKFFEESYGRYTRKLEMAVYGRKLFVTEGGSLGLGDPEVQPGDEIVFLPGSPHPFAIRDFDGDSFTLLGDCYVYGFHALKLFEDHEKPIKEYIFR